MGEKQLDLPTIISFIRYCLLNGAQPEQIRDALLVANLDRDLIHDAFTEIHFREESSLELALDFEKAGTDPALKIPEPSLQKLRRSFAERVELSPTPHWPGAARPRTARRTSVRKSKPLSLREYVLRSAFALWILMGIALFSGKSEVVQLRHATRGPAGQTLSDAGSLKIRSP